MASITLNKARTIIRKTLEKGTELALKPLSVIVLDDGWHAIAFERSDGAAPGRFGIAHGKAYGAVMLGMAGQAHRWPAPSNRLISWLQLTVFLVGRLCQCRAACWCVTKKAK